MDCATTLSSEPDRRANIRRLSRRALAVLGHDPIWSGPTGEIAIQAVVARNVETMLVAGEQDETRILEGVLRIVCNGRFTSALVAKLAPADAGPDLAS